MGVPVPPPRVNVLPLAAVTRSVPLSTNLSKMNGSKRSIRRLHCRFITRAREPSKRRSSAVVSTRTNSLAQAKLRARVARSADRLQQSSPRPAIRYRLQGAENRLTFAPLCAKGRNPPGRGRRIAVPVPPCAAIREEACFVRSWPLFAGCSRTFRLGGGPVASRGSGARQIRPGDFRGRLRGLPSRRPGPCLRDESHGPDGSPAPALYDRPRTREPSRG